MGFCRRIARQLLFERRKTDKRHTKEILKGCVHNLFKGSLQKILLSAAGITLFVQPLLAETKITPFSKSDTKVEFDNNKTYTITTKRIKGKNAFNAFTDFTLSSNHIANLIIPENTENLLNFVKNKIDIRGTLNAMKGNKYGGNLYFLSSEGLILGKDGVINAGAFYAMTPTEGFMGKFLYSDGKTFNTSSQDCAQLINYIVDRKISEFNERFDYGVSINPYGEIQIDGTINTINGIGLYAGGIKEKKDKNGKIEITKGSGLVTTASASLNTLSIEDFKSIVNVKNTNFEIADSLESNGGNIELVSVQSNTHESSKITELIGGYTTPLTFAEAHSKVDISGNINSRNNVSVNSYACNGHVEWISKKKKKDKITGVEKEVEERTFEQVSNLARVKSELIVDANINATSNKSDKIAQTINIKSTADNINPLTKANIISSGIEVIGDLTPINVDANELSSVVNSKIQIKENADLKADVISVSAIANSISVAGAKTSSWVTHLDGFSSKLNNLPMVGIGVNVASTSSLIDFNGKANSTADDSNIGKNPAGISLNSISNNYMFVAAIDKSSGSESSGALALSIGINKNNSDLNIGKNANFDSIKNISLNSITNSVNSVTAASVQGSGTAYAIPAIAISNFESNANGSVEGNIRVKSQVGTFTFKIANNILSDEITAMASVPSPQSWNMLEKKEKDGLSSEVCRILGVGDYLSKSTSQDKTKFSIVPALAWGSGKHSSNLIIQKDASINTSGNLELLSDMYVHDVKYHSVADDNCFFADKKSKFESSIALLVSDFDYSSNINIMGSDVSFDKQPGVGDDNLYGYGVYGAKGLKIESSVRQPYNRVKSLKDDFMEAIDHIESYFSKTEWAEAAKKVKDSANKLFKTIPNAFKVPQKTNWEQFNAVWRETEEFFMSLYDITKKVVSLDSDGLIGRSLDIVKSCLSFKEYSNFLNYCVSSSVNTSRSGDKEAIGVNGSFLIGTNTSKSNLYIGENAVLNAVSNASNTGNISLGSISDVTTSSMVGGLPILNKNVNDNSCGISLIVHNNSSEANITASRSVSIGCSNTGDINIYTKNSFMPVDIVYGTGSSKNLGMNGMASVLNGKSYSNIIFEQNAVLTAGGTIKLDAYNNTEAENIVGALNVTQSKGIGVGLAITLFDKENQIKFEEDDSLPATATTKISADSFEAVAKTSGTINTIGVAGSIAIDNTEKYDTFNEKGNMVNDFLSGSTIDSGLNSGKYALGEKLLSKVPKIQKAHTEAATDLASNLDEIESESSEGATQPSEGTTETSEGNPSSGSGTGSSNSNNYKLSLTLNGSAAANGIKNKTLVEINKADFVFTNKNSRNLYASAINSAHTLVFSGAAGVIAQGDNGDKTSVGVDGSVAANVIDNTTKTLISDSNVNDAKQFNVISINGGETIAAGLGLQVMASEESDSSGSGAINASVNHIKNKISSKLINTNSNATGSAKITNMVVTAYESDTQVTGGISASVGKQQGAVGTSFDIAMINNSLTAEVENSKLYKVKDFKLNSLQASTIVNAGIAVAAATKTDNPSDDTFVFSGSGVYSELKNDTSVNIDRSTIESETFSINARDVRTNVEGVKPYEANLVRNGKNVSFIEKDGKAFYKGLETATSTTKLEDLASKRKGSLLVTIALSGAGGDIAAGLGTAINEIDNTFNIDVENSTITADKQMDVNAETHTSAITLGIGVSVSTGEKKGSGVGSAAWNSIKNKANLLFTNNNIISDSLNLKSFNQAKLYGIGGGFSISTGADSIAAVGASLAYNKINNSSNSNLFGGSVTGKSNNTSEFSVNAANNAEIVGVAVSGGYADEASVCGTVVINNIHNDSVAAVGSSSYSLTNINDLNKFNIIAKDSADIKALSGAVTVSKKVSVGGAVTVNHIKGETQSILDNTSFNSKETEVYAYSDSNNLSLSAGLGGGQTFAFDGAAVNNDIFRDVKTTIASSTINNASSTFEAYTTAIGNTGSLAAVVCGAKDAALGAGISVNRMGGDIETSLSGVNFTLKNLIAKSYSNQEITTIGIAGSGSGVSLSGSIAYNSIDYNTESEIKKSYISSENNIAVIAQSDDILKNYAGVLDVGIGVSTPSYDESLLTSSSQGILSQNDNLGFGSVISLPESNSNFLSSELNFNDSSEDSFSFYPRDNRSKFRKIFNGYSSSLHKGHNSGENASGKSEGVGVGVSVAVNKIGGKTKASVDSNNTIFVFGKNTNDKVSLENIIDNSDINKKYADSSTISINSSLAGKRGSEKKTGLIIDSSSTHTMKSFLASAGLGGKVGVNANVNVNYIGGETSSLFEDTIVNNGKKGNNTGNISVKASDYTNTAGFIGNLTLGGTAAVGASTDTNKVHREITSKVSNIKSGSVAKNLEVKSISKQGISSVLAGFAASLKVGVAGNIDIALLNSTTKALIEGSKISVNSLDVEANHYARSHTSAIGGAVGASTAGVSASVLVNNDTNKVSAGIDSSTINANSGSNGAFKVNSINDDDFETITGAGSVGIYAGVAGAVAVDYIQNKVDASVTDSNIGSSTSRVGSVEIKAKDISKLVSKGGIVNAGGYAGVGAIVEVNTLDGQTNTTITGSNIYASGSVDIGSYEERNSDQFAVSVSAGLAGVGANILVVNSGKKLNLDDSGSIDANNDTNKALGMADEAISTDFEFNKNNTFTDDELKTIFGGTPTFIAYENGKAVTLTKIDKSIIDSKSGKISSYNIATGSLSLSNNGGSGGAGAVLGCFGYIYDNKNVITSITNSHLNAGNGIDINSLTYGKSKLSLIDAVAGIGDYAGAFGYVNMAGNTSVGIASSRLINTKDSINIFSADESAAEADSRGYTFGGVGIGTIIAKAKNNSSSDVTISNSRIANNGDYTASNTISISAEKNNKISAIGYSGNVSAINVSVVRTLAQDNGTSTVKLDTGNYFVANVIDILASNRPKLNSKFYSWSAGIGLGVGVGNVTTSEYGTSRLIANKGNNFKANRVGLGSSFDSESSQVSEAYTVTVGIDGHSNKADTLSSSNVLVDVNIGKNDFDKGTILNIYGDNNASATIDVYGASVGGILSVANNSAKAIASLTTNVNVQAESGSKLSQINVSSASGAYHKLHANGDGGGILSISPDAANTNSKMVLNTNTNLSKNLTADEISAEAHGKAEAYLTSDAVQGELAGGFGTNSEFIADLKSKVNLSDNSNINAESVSLKAVNDFSTGSFNPSKKDKTIFSKNYGLLTGADIVSEEIIDSYSEINIGKSASITASKDINIDAMTKTDLNNKVQAGGAGLGSHPGSWAINTLNINNSITTEKNSSLNTNYAYANINLGTSNQINTDFSAYTEVEGSLGGSTVAKVDNRFTFNNQINIGGKIYSLNDINIYADSDSYGRQSFYKIKNSAEAYTRSVIPWSTNPGVDNIIDFYNNINIGSNSKLDSVRNVILSTKDANLSIKNYTKAYNWYKKDKDGKTEDVSTVADGENNENIAATYTVNIDGMVTAGFNNNIDLKIDGKVNFDPNISGDFDKALTITCNKQEYVNNIATDTFEYGNQLFTRYQELETLANDNKGTEVGLHYSTEADRILAEMEKYGLYNSTTKEIINSLYVDYIKLPDMVCSGGNIYITAKDKNSVSGTGSLIAKGAPKIKIENNSNLYMKINDLLIAEPGGEIVFNNEILGNNAKKTLSEVKTVKTDDSKGSSIEVKENWKGSYNATLKYVDPKDNKTKTRTEVYTPLTNIEINGHVDNDFGTVSFFNASKDIVLQGKTATDSATINGASISISAPQGTIAQGYSEGITNIGYTPEAVLRDYYKKQENALLDSVDITSNVTTSAKKKLTEADIISYANNYKKSDNSSGVWISGGTIYINGEGINVNGLIQSGYSKFELTLTESDEIRIKEIKDNYVKSGKKSVSTPYLEQYCKINEGGMKWDAENGLYNYVVQAYYNPETDCISLEDVVSQGGRIYLTGRISNTGGGKIYVADGASDINIKNETDHKLVAKSIEVNDKKGLISITDLAKSDDDILATVTEMTSDSTKVSYKMKKDKPQKASKVLGAVASYTPKIGLTYNWSTGYDVTTKYRYEESYKFVFWGLIDYGKKCIDSMMDKIKEGELSPASTGGKNKKTGNSSGTPMVSPDSGYSIYLDNKVGTKTTDSGGYTKYNSKLHFSGTHYAWSTYTQGSTRAFQHSIKADYPIAIKFIKGNGGINLVTQSDLQLESNVINNKGNVIITSKEGSIEQSAGKIYADNIWLNAATGIGTENAITQSMQSDKGTLSAVTEEGDIKLVSKNIAGASNANLNVTAITDSGDVSLTTDASILQSGNEVDIKGSRIYLVSNYGSIGTKNAALKINAGQEITKPGDTLSASVNTKAKGDVALNQTIGDMRIGTIVSYTGDVYLTSTGSVLDVLPPGGTEKVSDSTKNLIKKWKELGIISENGEDNSAEKKQEALTAYKNSVYSAYDRYTNLKKNFSNNDDTSSDLYNEYLTLKEKFGNYSSADKWLEAQNKDKDSQWYYLQNEVVYGWTQDALLYAIQDSIINREEGSTIVPKSANDANITARNIYINAGGGIGRDEGYAVVDISNLQYEEGHEALKAIAAAEATDVKWGYNGDKVDKDKATINKVNALKINAKGKLEASAKGNIYFEDCNNNAINLVSVTSKEGNVRVYGNNGIYNAAGYIEGNLNNKINLSGKDLILEAGNGSIGTNKVPVTTNMTGFITARSNNLINLYQISKNAMTFASVYSGSYINIRALNDILSVYTGKQAEELGYINAKGDITLYSDKGDIGQPNGKGLRVKLAKDKVVNAEANSVYLKCFSDDSQFNLGKITAREGNIGIDSKSLDLVLKNDINAKNLEFNLRSLTQDKGSVYVSNLLKVVADNGILLSNYYKDADEKYHFYNNIAQASLLNNKSGDIMLYNNRDLTLYTAVNKANDGKLRILNKGSVTAKNGLSSNGRLFIWATGNIDIEKDTSSKDWMGLYASNGYVKANNLTADSLDISSKTGLTVRNVTANSYIGVDVESGDILTDDLTSNNNSIKVITSDGNITSKKVMAKADATLIANHNKNSNINNGNLSVGSITSSEGEIEAIGYSSLTSDYIESAKNFLVGSYGDVSIGSLTSGINNNKNNSELLDDSESDEFSYLIGNNIVVKEINIEKSFAALADDNFNSDKISIGNNGEIEAINNISINEINSGNDLSITSYENGSVEINSVENTNGDLNISNNTGRINIKSINSGGNVTLSNSRQGDIKITENITNDGSLYANLEDGDFYIKSADINGLASVYSEKGNILMSSIDVGDELDVRAKNGGIAVGVDENDKAFEKTTIIGGDATLHSDTDRVVIADAEVGGNMKINAQKYAVIASATVGGSMLMSGDETGVLAKSLNVGDNLILKTQTGSIKVDNAVAGKHSYVAIDGNGGNIEIENIKTGNDLDGSLIVVSHSDIKNNNYIDIKKAVAAYKMIINSLSNIQLNEAYALNGKLEVKAAGDIVAKFIQSAKEIYIATLLGIIDITKVISGDNIRIINVLGSKTNIDDIQTLNPDADISIEALVSGLNLTNASTTKDIKFKTVLGDVYIDNVYAGKDVIIDSHKSNINIKNTSVGNDINLKVKTGNIDISNCSAGNDLISELNGKLTIKDSTVRNNTVIVGNNNSQINIDNLKSKGFDLKDYGKSDLNIANSTIEDKTRVELGGSAKFEDSSIANINATIGGDLTINNLSNSLMSSVVDGNATISNLTSDKMTAVLSGKSSVTGSKLGEVDLTNKGEVLIKDSTLSILTAANSGNLDLTTTPVNSLDLTNNYGATASIHNTTINKINSTNDGELNVNKLSGDTLELTSNGNTYIDNSKITSINANISGSAFINNSVLSHLSLVNNGNTIITDSTSNKFDLTNTGESTIKDSNVKIMSAANDGNLELTSTPVNSLDLSNKSYATASIHDTSVKSMTVVNNGELIVNSIKGDELDLTSSANANINDSNIKTVNATLSGSTEINNLVSSHLSFANSGNTNIIKSTTDSFKLSNTGKSTIKDSSVKSLKVANDGKLEIDSTPIDNMNLTSKSNGDTSIHDTKINTMVANNDGKLEIDSTPIGSMNLNNKSNGNASIHDSTVNSLTASNDGELKLNTVTSDKLELTSAGNTYIADSNIKSINANSSGKLDVSKLESSILNLTSSGNTNIVDSKVTNINANISGEAQINKITTDKLVLNNSGKTNINDSNINIIDANISGSSSINNSVLSLLSLANSGNTIISNTTTNKINITNSGKTNLNNIEVSGSGYFVNKNGNLNIDQLDVSNNFDLDSNAGSISMKGIDIKKDFNFALAGNSGVKFTDITIGNDFNVYAGKAVLNGTTLNVGNNLNTYTYSKYSAPKATIRAAVAPSSGTAKAKGTDEGFTLILNQLNIGGGLYVNNPDVTIKVKESEVGHDVKIDAGKEKIQIDKLDVDGGNLDIKGTTGSIKLGEIKVDNDTKINLSSGNLEVSDLTSKQEIDFNVGGNITSDKSIETENKSVNMIAGGSVNAYKVLAKQQGNIEAVNGDIIIGQIDGKTLVFREDSNDRTLRIREANVETNLTAGADYIDIDLINQTANNNELGIDFTLVNGRAMDNVVIRDVKTDKGVNMFNLVSMYGNIHVSNEIFNLTKTYLLKNGDLSNTSLKFRLFGDNPTYSKDPDIIAFFAPRINHKNFADISFTNVSHSDSQDYYPLIAKGDYKRMFNQYTVVQEFEILRLAYEDRIDDLHDDIYGNFDYRRVNNSKAFYVDLGEEVSTDGESVNLDGIDIPLGFEFNSVSGELKAVGTRIKPQRAMD